MRKVVGAAFIALGVVACSSGDVGQSHERVDYICNETATATLDGIPAYAFCGNTDVWSNNGVDTKTTSGGAGWIRTETNYGYQCTELALRYERFKFGVTTVWPGISYAYQMCATHPAAMSTTNAPIQGDLMIFAPNSCGADSVAGHVAVVDTVNASTIDVLQQNPAAKTTYNTACASCFLHAANNHGTNDPCEESTLDGVYCGQSVKFPAGTANVLYDCQSGATTSQTTCANGCVPEPSKTDDFCASAPPADAGTDASAIDASPPSDSGVAPPADASPTDDGGAITTPSSGGCSTSSARDRDSRAWLVLVGLALALRARASSRSSFGENPSLRKSAARPRFLRRS